MELAGNGKVTNKRKIDPRNDAKVVKNIAYQIIKKDEWKSWLPRGNN